MWAHAATHLPLGRAGDYNQAVMDLGARICIPKNPKCSDCPIASCCSSGPAGTSHLYPPPKQKKRVPETHLACVVLERRGKYWLGRRPDEGLWGGLWEFPTTPWTGGADFHAVEAWSGKSLRRVGEIRHVLTHKIIHLSVFTSTSTEAPAHHHYDNFSSFSPAEMDAIGTSRLTSKALEMFQAST